MSLSLRQCGFSRHCLSDILQILNDIILLTVKQFKDSVFGVAAALMQPGIQTLDEHEESLFT